MAELHANLRKTSHVERLALNALSGDPDPEAAARRLISFFETVQSLAAANLSP